MVRDRVKIRVRIRLRDKVRVRNGVRRWSVSYTHLTLPTILRV